MEMLVEICIAFSLISLNMLLWVLCYAKYLKPLELERNKNRDRNDLNTSDEETIRKEKLAKEWANMMNYNGIKQGGD